MTIADIIARAAHLTPVPAIDITSSRQDRKTVRVRHAVAWVARHTTAHSLPMIGRALGDRDHTTILNSIQRAEAMRANDPTFRALTDRLVAA